MTERVCAVDGCDRPAACRGWCNAHYARWYARGDLDEGTPIKARRPPIGGPCEVDGCEANRDSHGMCARHARLVRVYGSLEAAPKPKHRPPLCAVEGCTRPPGLRNLCTTHYSRWRSKGVAVPTDLRPPWRLRCAVCDSDIPDDRSQSARAMASLLNVNIKTVQKHRSRNHDESEEWHASRAAWWVSRHEEVLASAPSPRPQG